MGCRPLMSSAIVPRFSHSRSTSPRTFSPTATTRLHNHLSHHGSARRRDRLGAASLGRSAPGGLTATSRMDASVSPNSRPRSNTTAQLVSDRIRSFGDGGDWPLQGRQSPRRSTCALASSTFPARTIEAHRHVPDDAIRRDFAGDAADFAHDRRAIRACHHTRACRI